MKQAVVITTSWRGEEPCRVLLDSLRGCRYPVWVVLAGPRRADPAWLEHLGSTVNLLTTDEDEWEMGAIAAVLERTGFDEFVLFQDTFEVTDPSFLADVFAYPGSVALSVAGFHYNMKYRRVVLERLLPLPQVRTKAESVHQEHTFARRYFEAETDGVWTFDPAFHDGEHKGFVEKFGRTNMLLANDFYRKYKGDWGQRAL